MAFTQDEVAFLLGARSGAKISRYERFAREPSLETVFAFEAIFRRPASELFPGIYQGIAQKVAHRAKALKKDLERNGAGQCKQQKLQALLEIIDSFAD